MQNLFESAVIVAYFFRKGFLCLFCQQDSIIILGALFPLQVHFSAKKGIIYNCHSEIKSYLNKPAALFLKICKTVTDKATRRKNNN